MSIRSVIKLAGESGTIGSAGMMVAKALKNLEFEVYAEREFPSLIKGGRANMMINFSRSEVRALSSQIDLGIGLDREGLLDCLETVKKGGLIIHGFDRWKKAIKKLPKIAEEKNYKIIELPARQIAIDNGGSPIMVNTVLLGFAWKVLGLDIHSLKDQINRQFAKKPKVIPINETCAQAGYDFIPENWDQATESIEELRSKIHAKIENKSTVKGVDKMLIDGNSSFVMGAVEGGVRAYYGYPMSPSSSILVYMAKIAKKYNI